MVEAIHHLSFAVLLISALKRKWNRRGRGEEMGMQCEHYPCCNGGKRVRKLYCFEGSQKVTV
jgi:hypothetical protein